MSIFFITDQRPGEPDILFDVRFEPLRVTDLDGGTVAIIAAPLAGWDHSELTRFWIDPALTKFGADAYLGNTWVGSTEV